MTKSQKVTIVSNILKLKFPGLVVKDAIDLAFIIVDKLENE